MFVWVLLACVVGAGWFTEGRYAAGRGVQPTSVLFVDDFDGPPGARPDPARWSYDMGAGGWGNGESQTYTDDSSNVQLDGAGRLVITARGADDGITSARLTTDDRFSFVHGRAEARLKLPAGAGLHPAFWLLGADLDRVGWPESGEIDVVEAVNGADFTHHSLHGPSASGTRWTVGSEDRETPSLTDDFHVYWVERDPGRIAMGIDDRTTASFEPGDLRQGDRWVFDKPFFLLLNVAVGGAWPGPVDPTAPFQSSMLVDWVRVTDG
ncbi:glycoside hydrolase family 16 protein [Rhodococcus sp. ABRD24]|uniref:glycoside hydrolase family 16 protein n=1 Tax=Rhodococcus sp. ABRD24 TaxID=2507582 RepID=UPI00103A5525|nr:glycoside hydrolase family 16 protein [Rhodococcus sp. ABRD24]QBJ97637.1 glycoside hydrolase family 16 protein [Rhodococcus sp. ABRD24]